MQDMQVCPDYVPDPKTDAMPNDIAGQYYTVYKLAQPRIVDLDSAATEEYVRLIVETLQGDKARLHAVLELLQTLEDDGQDERVVIYSMAKLINSVPLLFIGFSALLQKYTIEPRNMSNLSYKKSFREPPVLNFQGKKVANLGLFFQETLPKLPPECQGAIVESMVEIGDKRRNSIAVNARRLCLTNMVWPYALHEGLLLLSAAEFESDSENEDDTVEEGNTQPATIMAKEHATYLHTLANCKNLRDLYVFFLQTRPERQSRADMCKFYALSRQKSPGPLDFEDSALRALVNQLDSLLLTEDVPVEPQQAPIGDGEPDRTSMLFKFEVRCSYLECLGWVNKSKLKLDTWAVNNVSVNSDDCLNLLLQVRAVVQTVNLQHTRQYCKKMIQTYQRYIRLRNTREFGMPGFTVLYPGVFRKYNMDLHDACLETFIWQLENVLHTPELNASEKFDCSLASWARRAKEIQVVVPAAGLVQRVFSSSNPHPVPLDMPMEHIDLFFDMSREKNDADIQTIVQSVGCFREFAKRFFYQAECKVKVALAMINTTLSNMPVGTQEKMAAVQANAGVSEREALCRLIFCDMNVNVAVQNVKQDRNAMQIMQLVEGCTEDYAQTVLKQQHNDVNQAVDFLMSQADPAPPVVNIPPGARKAQALEVAVQHFIAATGEEEVSARSWLERCDSRLEVALRQFHHADEVATRAGKVVIDATAAGLGLKSIHVKGGHGHCFYLTVSQQLLLFGVDMSFQELRTIAADEIIQAHHAGTLSWIYPIYFSAEPANRKSFREWCASVGASIAYCGDNPVWADDLSITSLLNGLFKKGVAVILRIIASRQETPSSGKFRDFQSQDVQSGELPTLLLTICHLYGRHYLGTVPLDNSSRQKTDSDKMEIDPQQDANALGLLSDTAMTQERASTRTQHTSSAAAHKDGKTPYVSIWDRYKDT